MRECFAALVVVFALVCALPVSAKPVRATKQSHSDQRAQKARRQLEEDLRLRGSMIPWKHSR